MSLPRILHYPGSKWRLAEWIISHMPSHSTYLEPFFGSGAVFFNKSPSTLETINDIDGEIVNLFRIIRERPEELALAIRWTPYARQEYDEAHVKIQDDLERARRMLVRCWQSIRVKSGSKSGWKCRGTPDDSYRIKQWNNLPEQIVQVAARLKDVQIECRPALNLLDRFNRPDALIYCDPPYMLGTRNGTIYQNEMTDSDHEALLDALQAHSGPAMISGYANPLYDFYLCGWERKERQQIIETGQSRTEILWLNPVVKEQVEQFTLF